MIASFSILFDRVKPGGMYVIEDIHLASDRNWGAAVNNTGISIRPEAEGNDPAEMKRFLLRIRERPDVYELTVHLSRICFIRKALQNGQRAEFNRGDRIEDLYPPVPGLAIRAIRKLRPVVQRVLAGHD